MNIKNERTDELFKGILSLKNLDECYAFFEDLCTVKEILEMSKRLEGAAMLKNGSVYTEVAEKTGLSTATISRISRCLKYGDGGYGTVLSRMENDKE